jgi:phosphodiesterase/alkaline phosphatase D-like protein
MQSESTQQGVMLMMRFILGFAFIVAISSLLWARFAEDRVLAAGPADHAALVAGPALELATDTSAIVRWTTTNPGGTDRHDGIVHYGTDPSSLTQIAKSPNRRNPTNPEMIFRVRILGLSPHTLYYYRVESAGATGASDRVSSAVRTFKTQ